MMIEKLLCIIGWPVHHSLSPIMQNRALLELGLNTWAYVPLPVMSEHLQAAIRGLLPLGFVGANVTVPHKEAVLPYLDKLSKTASEIGAVNTIVVEQDGSLSGHNTDGLGFVADLVLHNIFNKNLRVVVLGAGGSARAIVHALVVHGCTHITILNRTISKADDLAKKFNVASGPLDDHFIKQMPAFDLVINTTSIGLNETKDQMAWNGSVAFSREQIVYDLIYNPPETTLLRHAKRHGARAINGLGMLVHQGAAALKLWTGQEAPVAIMHQTLLDSLEENF